MYATVAAFPPQDVFVLLPSFLVDTNESLRQRALRLVTHGVSQKVLAGKMGMTPSTFSRWLNQKDGINPVSVAALDGFNAYVLELTGVLLEKTVAADAAHDPPAPPRRHESGRSEAAEKKGRHTGRKT